MGTLKTMLDIASVSNLNQLFCGILRPGNNKKIAGTMLIKVVYKWIYYWEAPSFYDFKQLVRKYTNSLHSMSNYACLNT